MCYSAQVLEQYDEYVKVWGAKIDLTTFARLYGARLENDRLKIPQSLDTWFRGDSSSDGQSILASIAIYQQQQASKLEQELFKQKTRMADAERTLLSKTTRAATEAKRISSNKIEWALSKLADLRRTERRDVDSRIFPGYYAPVMVMENGQKVVKPMRYQCRPAGKPTLYDSKYPGTYNARRDNLEGFWKDLFGYHHGIMIVNAFYEHVVVPKRNTAGSIGIHTKNVLLEFKPGGQFSVGGNRYGPLIADHFVASANANVDLCHWPICLPARLVALCAFLADYAGVHLRLGFGLWSNDEFAL